MSKIVSGLLALYIASFLYLEIPYIKLLPNTLVSHLAVLGVLFALLFVMLSRIVVVETRSIPIAAIHLLAFLGMLTTVLFYIVPLAYVHALPYHLSTLFAGDMPLTVWLVVPLLLLAF